MVVSGATVLATTAAGLAATAAPAAAADAATGVWSRALPASSPPARMRATSAYDAARAQVVLFGGQYPVAGYPPYGYLGDTWTWNGGTWTQRTPATSPAAREGAVMAYDAARGETVLFGGYQHLGGGSLQLLADTWVWNGTTWTQRTPATSPPGLWGAAMTYDSVRGEVVLFGGSGPGGGHVNGTWVWDGTTWTQRTPGTSPGARAGAAFAFDAARGESVLFGGSQQLAGGGCCTTLSDTWTWNGSSWTQESPSASPPATSEGRLAFSPDRGEAVLFTGAATWGWNGVTWSRHTAMNEPSARYAPALAFHGASRSFVLFGGAASGAANSETWLYQTFLPSGGLNPYPSDDCTTTLVDTYSGATHVALRSREVDANTQWICVRVDGPSLAFGGKLVVDAGAAVDLTEPSVDANAAACRTASGNTMPPPRPLASGAIGDPSDPATYLPYEVDAYTGQTGSWLCVTVGSLKQRVVVDAVGVTAPTATFLADPPAPHPSEPPVQPVGSSACRTATTGVVDRVADVTTAGTRVSAYTWRQSDTKLSVCVRADGVADGGGVLTLDAAQATGAVPQYEVSTTDLTPCTVSVVQGTTPVPYSVRRSPTGALPASVCVSSGGTAVRVTLSTGPGGGGVATWSPDA